jgi:hypothetical protein
MSATTVFVPNVGEKMWLSYYLSANALTIRLVQNSWTQGGPQAGDSVVSNVGPSFTLMNYSAAASTTVSELSVAGYAAQTLTANSWSFSPVYTSSVTQPVTAFYSSTLTFTASAACTCYGYYVHNSVGLLMWEHQLSSAITVGSGGGSITIQPAITAT